MRRMPILVRPEPFLPRGCPRGMYAGLAPLSGGCTPDKGRLHTCYSPVRHSPAGGPKSSPAAVRLACVKPAASVHPEPGSNSPLLVSIVSYFLLRIVLSRTPEFIPLYDLSCIGLDGNLMFPSLSPVASLSLCSFASETRSRAAFLICGCKVTTFFSDMQAPPRFLSKNIA